ncbi:endonuclease V [Candidatus Woesearchaeota archaeon]|nr:endonuclease V [Candidatus Woesearchaeota archaeon]
MDLQKLKKEQILLAESVILKDKFDKIKLIAGVDQSYVGNNTIISAIVVCEYPSMKVIEKKFAVKEDVKFPYIASFLAYREVPVILEAYEKLENKPDIILCEFNGILHPRKCGAASHLGISLNKPTIGVAKKLSVGKEKEGQIFIDTQLRGVALRTKEHANPVYVSPGHLITLTTSAKIVAKCLNDHKLPEPLYLAHRYSTKLKKNLNNTDHTEQSDSMEKVEA